MAIQTAGVGSGSEAPREALAPANEITQYWIQIVRGEYLEIPGMLLTRRQIQRLWGFDADLGDKVLDALVEAGFLRRTPSGAFVRVDGGPGLRRQVQDPWRAPMAS